MRPIYLTLLDIIKQCLVDGEFTVSLPSSNDDWILLHKIAKSQKLWTMVFEKVNNTPEYLNLPMDIQTEWMQEAVLSTAHQIVQSKELFKICSLLDDENLKYIVLKGITCRRYYPNPNSRPSGDEDILIDWRDYKKCDELLKNNGYVCDDDLDFDNVKDKRETVYRNENNSLFLEVHFNAIGKENQRQKRLNVFFEDAFSHITSMKYEDNLLVALEPTYQLMHLLAHFYLHLYDSGVGVRQMLDILLAVLNNKGSINWNTVGEFLNKTKMNKVFAAILNVGEKYFGMGLDFVPQVFWNNAVAPEPMLEDMLDGGIYGQGENGERHLAENFTLDVDTEQSNLLAIIFPNKERLANRYSVLNKYPMRYPLYVVKRWFDIAIPYIKNKNIRKKMRMQIEVGKKRKNMLEMYSD